MLARLLAPFMQAIRSLGGAYWLRILLVAAANATTVMRLGFYDPLFSPTILLVAQGLLLLAALVPVVLLVIERSRREGFRAVGLPAIIDGTVAAAAALAAFVGFAPFAATLAAALLAALALRLVLQLIEQGAPSSLVLVGSFATMIALGAGALKLPAATPPDAPITVVDAIFTATSATCVTGLIVRDTPTTFTRFGHSVILVLMQLGGLGILAFAGILLLAVGSGLGLRASTTIGDVALENRRGPQGIRRMLAFIVLFTFLAEFAGATMLFFSWPETWPNAPEMSSFADRAFHCAFFGVSAFTNAGFATTPDSLESLRTHWTSHVIIVPLIVIGGLGYPALDNIRQVVFARISGRRMRAGRLVRIALHTRIVLVTTAVLYTAGVAAIVTSETVQENLSPALAVLDAHFMSAASRTAGFNTVPVIDTGPLARFVLTVLMFIGGGPASTAGGIKVTTFAVLVLTVIATLRGREATEAFRRTIPDQLVRRAAVVVTLGLATVTLLTGFLSLSESGFTLEQILFESVSASATVGLSMGITPELSVPGRLAVALAMFVGRLGPLAVLAALASVRSSDRASFSYPHEGVIMG